MGKLLLICGGILVGFFGGFTISTMWNWFVVPTFHLPALTTMTAYGICLMLTLFSSTKAEDDEDKAIGNLILTFIKVLLVLGLGTVVHLFA